MNRQTRNGAHTAGIEPMRRPDGFFERGQNVTRLEAFVDAAFAFAMTLLAISIDSVPGNREELVIALKGVPAFAASFFVISLFWWDHNQWSRRFGLDDGRSIALSLLFVFLVLIFVYPLKLMFTGMFAWLTDGWLTSTYAIAHLDDLKLMFTVYALAFASIGLTVVALHWNAWKKRDDIQLDPLEQLLLKRDLWRQLCLPITALLSLWATVTLGPDLPSWRYPLPGVCYFLLSLQFAYVLLYRKREAALRAQLGLGRA